jgi:hypothetical protein
MKKMALILGMLAGLIAGACDTQFNEAAPGDDNAVRDDDKLPGGCNNPVACGTTGTDPNGAGGGTPPAGCYGCDCKTTQAARDACHRCSTRCGRAHTECLFNSDNTAACDEANRDCERGCID